MNVTWPFAQLKLTSDRLVLKVMFLATYVFKPAQVTKIEPYGFIPFAGKGVRIHHQMVGYPEKIVFWYLCINPQPIVDKLRASGYGHMPIVAGSSAGSAHTMTTSDPNVRSRVLLSVQRALVGAITPQMRFIGLEFSAERAHIIVWHDGPVDGRVNAEFDAGVVTQMVADFAWPEHGDPQISFEFIRCDFPHRPDFRGTLVYGRSETNAA